MGMYFSGAGHPEGIERTRKTVTFDGSAGGGASGTVVAVFTVTGQVLVHVAVGFCKTNLTEAGATATISLGTTNNVAVFIAAMDSVDLDANDWWASTTPTAGSINATGSVETVFVSEAIIVNPLVQNTTAGVVEFTVLWEPLSDDGLIVPA